MHTPQDDEEGILIETGSFKICDQGAVKLLQRENQLALLRAKKDLKDWQSLYQRDFNIPIDIEKIVIPPYRIGFNRLIVVAQTPTPKIIFHQLQKEFPCHSWIDLVKVTSIRKTDQAYAIWVRDIIESDEDLVDKSANQLQQENINCITLEEHLLFHYKLYQETKENTSKFLCWNRKTPQYLDIQRITLCAGSRVGDGDVPLVFWFSGKVHVSLYYPDDAHDDIRARSVVS